MKAESIENRFNTRVLFEGGLRVFWVLLALLLLLASLDWLLRSDTYKVGQLQFEGSFERVTEVELEKVTMSAVRGNYLMLDLEDIRKSVESLPWVRKATVRRSWPDGVHIRFVEEQPVANWGNDHSLGTDGQVIPAVATATAASLPRLDGPEGTSQIVLAAYGRFERIAQTMGEHVRTLQLSSRRSWLVTLGSGIELVIDQDQAEQKLERLALVYRGISGKPKRIDLRYTNGFAVEQGGAAGSRAVNK